MIKLRNVRYRDYPVLPCWAQYNQKSAFGSEEIQRKILDDQNGVGMMQRERDTAGNCGLLRWKEAKSQGMRVASP